ncbi:MAG: hypothetical protein QM751_03125 [Paludibacteraceae bacterium]
MCKLRGPGDVEETQQSEMPFEMNISNLTKDGQLLEIAQNTAMEVLEKDISLSSGDNEILLLQLKKMKTNPINWGAIS